MKYKNTLSKKILFIYSLSLISTFTIALGISVFLIIFYVQTTEKTNMNNIINNVNVTLYNNLENSKKLILAISEDKSLEYYVNTSKISALNHFLSKFKDISPTVNFFDMNSEEIKNPIFKEALEKPNTFLLSPIKYNQLLKKYVFEFTLYKSDYFETERYGVIFGYLLLDDLLGKEIEVESTLTTRIINQNGEIEYSTNKNEIHNNIDIGDNLTSTIKDNTLELITIMNNKTFSLKENLFTNNSIIIVSKDIYKYIEFPLIMFILVLIILLISFLISRYITKIFLLKHIINPIILLTKNSKLVSEGKSLEMLNINTNDEIETLNQSFYSMNIKIKDSLSKLENLNTNLKEEIEKEVKKSREKDRKLISQMKLAQMGEMISMIAHQWRQPLSAISATSSAINLKSKLNLLDKESIEELSTNITNYTQHLSSTIDDFREFFKVDKEKKTTTYTDIINSVSKIIEISLIDKKIKLIKKLNCEHKFNTYPNEIKQVVLNLIKNAEDILIENEIKNPEITIETNNKTLIIRDNGGGIPNKIIDKIFDPYFSTKLQKDGMGLGLYMSKIIIEDHCKGTLSVLNDEEGAVFRITIGENNE